MNRTARYRQKDRIAGRDIAGESFLIPVCGQPSDMENIFILNPQAGFIWQRLDGKRTVAAIIADIVEDFSVASTQAGADMDEFIGQLLANGLIEEVT
jgi:hypothetical protein